MAKHIKKALCVLLILSLPLTMLPAQVWAVETDEMFNSTALTDDNAENEQKANTEPVELETPNDEASSEDEPEETIPTEGEALPKEEPEEPIPAENEALPEDEPVAYSDSDLVTYAVTGGNLYFDKSTGKITECDKNVTEAVISSTIEGVSVTSIGGSAFSGCSGLTSVTIPNSVIYIGEEAFYDCSGLTSVTIPNSVTLIGNGVFRHCSGLSSVTIPNSVTSIGDYAFAGCSGLTSVTIPNSVTSIGWDAFLGCSGLTSVTIPNSVTYIGSFAFYACNNITDIYYAGTKEQWASISIDSYNSPLTASSTTIHYNSPMPSNPSVPTGEITISSSNYNIYTGEEALIEARIPNGGSLTASDISWASSNEDIVKVVSSRNGTLGGSVMYAWATVRSVGQTLGTASITVKLSNGKTADCSVIGAGDKPQLEKPNYQAPEASETKEGYDLLKYRAEEWEEKYNKYLEKVAKALKKHTETDEGKRSAAIASKAAEMKQNDAASKSTHLTFPSNFPSSWKDYAYTALSTYLYDCTCSKMDFGGSLDTINMVNTVLNSMANATKPYNFGNVQMNVSAFQFSGTKTGFITCYNKSGTGETYTVVVNSTKNECRAAIQDFAGQLEDLETTAIYNVYTAVATDILGKSPSDFTEEWLKKKLGKYINEFSKSGVGNLINDLLDCKEYFSFVYKVSVGDIDAAEGLLSSLSGFSFERTTLTDKAVSKAMDALEGAGSKLEEAFNAYVKGELKESGWHKFWRTTFGCPVSISVYNSNQEQIGYVGEDDIWYTDAIRIKESGDAKIIDSYTPDKLSFSITGTDYGTMSCSVETYESGSIAVGRTNFYDIPVDSNTTLSLSLTGASESAGQTESVALTNAAGESIPMSEYISIEQEGGVEISCAVKTDTGATGGTVSGAGTYIRGDAVVLTASPETGYHFVGWYQGDALMSTSKVYEFSAQEDLELTAAFNLDRTTEDVDKAVNATLSVTDAHIVELEDPENLLTNGTVIFAARYENGKMLEILSGELQLDGADYTVKFSNELASGWVLFFLGADYVPICSKATL